MQTDTKHIAKTYIVPYDPGEYLKQGLSHCGVYTAKAVIESLKPELESKEPTAYHANIFSRTIGALSPNMLATILQKNGLHANVKSLNKNLNINEKINFLKAEISKGFPLILAIGNGYNHYQSHSKIKMTYQGHWISLWGYDEKSFYIYDSTVSKELYTNNIPVGNISRSHEHLIRDWYGSFIRFFLSWKPYLYISIENR